MSDMPDSSETSPNLRRPAVAGSFYPADAGRLWQAVETCIERGQAGYRPPRSAARAVISPHAGLRFSGWLAGAAHRAMARAKPDLVVILSPSHKHGFDGIALPSQSGFAMPGFDSLIHMEAAQGVIRARLAHIEDAAHDREHGIETQLGFIHRLHPGTRILPLVIGRTDPARVARLVDHLNKAHAPLFVLSSDLSHFLDLQEAQQHDLQTAHLIEAGNLAADALLDACGHMALRGFLTSQFGRGLRAQRLAMANSHDAGGDAMRVVGYGAWAFFDGDGEDMILPAHRAQLLKVARQALEIRLRKGEPPEVSMSSFPASLQGLGACFVTLTRQDRLRGCIGSLRAHQPLLQDVVSNAVKAGFADPRFRALRADELGSTRIKIAVLSPPAPLAFEDEEDLLQKIKPGRDGLILSDGRNRGTFLPMVWEGLTDPRAFLNGLKLKAGLPKTHWSKTLRIERFYAESFAEQAMVEARE